MTVQRIRRCIDALDEVDAQIAKLKHDLANVDYEGLVCGVSEYHLGLDGYDINDLENAISKFKEDLRLNKLNYKSELIADEFYIDIDCSEHEEPYEEHVYEEYTMMVTAFVKSNSGDIEAEKIRINNEIDILNDIRTDLENKIVGK